MDNILNQLEAFLREKKVKFARENSCIIIPYADDERVFLSILYMVETRRILIDTLTRVNPEVPKETVLQVVNSFNHDLHGTFVFSSTFQEEPVIIARTLSDPLHNPEDLHEVVAIAFAHSRLLEKVLKLVAHLYHESNSPDVPFPDISFIPA